MNIIRLKKGLSMPLRNQVPVHTPKTVYSSEYALLAEDFPYLKPKIAVTEGQAVKAGDALLLDKNLNELAHVSPVSGTVRQVIRGEKRAFIGIIVDKDPAQPPFKMDIPEMSRDSVRKALMTSGLWTALRTRPFGSVADPALAPSALFITAMDTRPLAAPVDAVIKGKEAFFTKGVEALSLLTDGKTYICKEPGSMIPEIQKGQIETVGFKGPHPAGLAGTHIHFLHPVCRSRSVWEIDYQEVIAIGELFSTGLVNYDRLIAFAGDGVANPGLVETSIGGNIFQIIQDFDYDKSLRIVSGSILYGMAATEARPWLGRYDRQISALIEGKKSTLFSWLTFGPKLFSAKRIFVSHIIKPKYYHFDTSMRGSLRSMVPIGSYEQVMPLDIVITPFLRYLDSGENEMLEKMGALELLEEDMSLLTYVSAEKSDFAPLLRGTLDAIRKEI